MESKRDTNHSRHNESNEDTQKFESHWKTSGARRAGLLHPNERACKIRAKSMKKKGDFQEGMPFAEPLEGLWILGTAHRHHRVLFNKESKRLRQELGDGRDGRSIVHTEHVTLRW